jgi:hypothetical protein
LWLPTGPTPSYLKKMRAGVSGAFLRAVASMSGVGRKTE